MTVDVGDRDAEAPRLNFLAYFSRLAREPLVHFFALGGLLFAVNAFVAPPAAKDKVIEVSASLRDSIVARFKTERSREPTAEELEKLIDVWILNEISYREALAQGLDKGDEMIRERIMQKFRLLVFANASAADPTDAELQQWLDSHRSRYDVPDQLSFFEVPIGGPDAAAEAAATLGQIESGDEPEAVRLRAHVFIKRPRPTVEEVFGTNFVKRLVALEKGRWQTMQSPVGWHIVRLDAILPGRPVTSEEVRNQLTIDLNQERVRSAAVGAIRDMGKRYVIRRSDRP